jgi:hypothetical protein
MSMAKKEMFLRNASSPSLESLKMSYGETVFGILYVCMHVDQSPGLIKLKSIRGNATQRNATQRNATQTPQGPKGTSTPTHHFADLEEAAGGAERLEAQPLVLARQGVKHHVHALVVRVAHQVLFWSGILGVERTTRAVGEEHVRRVVSSGARVN